MRAGRDFMVLQRFVKISKFFDLLFLREILQFHLIAAVIVKKNTKTKIR